MEQVQVQTMELVEVDIVVQVVMVAVQRKMEEMEPLTELEEHPLIL